MHFPPLRKRERIKQEARLRCPGHLDFVRRHGCCVPGCADMPIEVAHLRLGNHAGMGQKPDDDQTISLCRAHHAEAHRIGEASFQAKHSLDWKALAAEFARRSPAWQRFLAKRRFEG